MLGGVDRGECRCSTCEGVGGDTLLRGRLQRDQHQVGMVSTAPPVEEGGEEEEGDKEFEEESGVGVLSLLSF